MLVDQINQDLKSAMLAHDELKVSTLRSLKSALTYAVVDDRAKGGSGELDEAAILQVLARESKKRQDSADVYSQANAADRADKELTEKKIIDRYLPAQLTDGELAILVERTVGDLVNIDKSQIGPIIGKVKQLSEGRADGGRIASAVKKRLESAK